MCLEQDCRVSRGCYESEAVENKVEQPKRSPAHLRGNSNVNNQGHRTRLTQICGICIKGRQGFKEAAAFRCLYQRVLCQLGKLVEATF